MSVAAMSWVFAHSPYTLGTRLVHLAIADVANEDHDWQVWIAQGKIAEKAKVSRGTVVSAVKTMVDGGYLEVVEQHFGAPSIYRFLRPTCPISDTTCAIDGVKPARFTDPHCLLTKEEQKRARESDPLRGFEHFWNAYPKRKGRRIGRALCEKRWRALSLDDRRAAWHGAQNYAREVGDFAKDPDRWLRDRLWEDWQDASPDSYEGPTVQYEALRRQPGDP